MMKGADSVDPSENWMSLREFVAGLRSELKAAHDDAQEGEVAGEPRFVVGPVNVEFTLAARKEAGARGGVRFYVFDLGASGSLASESTQRVNLVLRPVTKDGEPYDMSDSMSVIPE